MVGGAEQMLKTQCDVTMVWEHVLRTIFKTLQNCAIYPILMECGVERNDN